MAKKRHKFKQPSYTILSLSMGALRLRSDRRAKSDVRAVGYPDLTLCF